MNVMQQILLGLLVVTGVVAYREQLVAALRRLVVLAPAAAPESVTLRVVDDIVAITELRDKLDAEGCPEGVEACTTLLRVIVEHRSPHGPAAALTVPAPLTTRKTKS